MARRRLVWVDVGMAIAVGGFIAIVAFARNGDSFVRLMLGFAAALVVWAIVAEYAIVRAEVAEKNRRSHPSARAAAQPLPH